MHFSEYQILARKTALYPNQGENYVYPTLGLSGESGEVADKIKKIIRDDDGIVTKEKQEELVKELGDVLWYVSNLCSELGINLDMVADTNIQKLFKRKEEGKIKGSGDNR